MVCLLTAEELTSMNQEKLSKLKSGVQIGGKGTPRRKKKIVHRTAGADDKKLQNTLKKLAVNSIPGIEEVNMIKDDGFVIHFTNPKVQASLQSNTFAVVGQSETKSIAEMLPGILNQLSSEGLTNLRKLAEKFPTTDGAHVPTHTEEVDDDDVPELVENFDEPSR
ncbi:unnamed protein product, partial [Pocillopora meandrina]